MASHLAERSACSAIGGHIPHLWWRADLFSEGPAEAKGIVSKLVELNRDLLTGIWWFEIKVPK